MPNYFAIGFVGVLACVGVGMEYHRQSVKAGEYLGPGSFVTSVSDSVSASFEERAEQIEEVRRAKRWQGEMRTHLPEAPDGWMRRGFDEGDNSAVLPAGAKVQTYGPDHPLSNFVYESFANLKNLKHVYAKERSGQSDLDFQLQIMTASSYIYERGDETVSIQLLLKEEQETETTGGKGLARSLNFAKNLTKFRAEPEPFAVIAGIPFYEAFDKEGLMLGHYRVLYAKIGLEEEVRLIVHANAGSDATRALLDTVDFEALNALLRIPMHHVVNGKRLPDARTEQKYSVIANYVRTVGEMNLKTHLLTQDTSQRIRQKPPALVEKYGADVPLRDMYVMQYRDAMLGLSQIEKLADQLVDMNDLIQDAAPVDTPVDALEKDDNAQAAEPQAAPAAPKPKMSEQLKQELTDSARKPALTAPQKAAVVKPQKIKVAAAKNPSPPASKGVKVNRLGRNNGNKGASFKRVGVKRSGCGGGSFCKVGN